MKRFAILILLGGWCCMASPGFAQLQYVPPGKAGASPSGPTKKNEEKPASLDQLIAEALKNNPDLRVAEAKVREAEAELYRTRIRVTTDLQGVHAEIEAAEAGHKEALIRWKRAEKLFQSGSLSREDYDQALLTYLKMNAELVAKQAKLPYLLGKQAGGRIMFLDQLEAYKPTAYKSSAEKAGFAARAASSDEEFLRRVTLDVEGRVPTSAETKSFMSLAEKTRREEWIEKLLKIEESSHPAFLSDLVFNAKVSKRTLDSKFDTSMTDKLRTALDAPILLKGEKFNQAQILDRIRDHLNGVNLHVRHKAPKDRAIEIQFNEPMPLGAFVQFIEDELECVFVLRDYGVVVVPADGRLPPGAIRVIDFWKEAKTADAKAQPVSKDGNDVFSNPPPVRVKGVVETVDAQDKAMVQISIGSVAGLKVGHTLDLYRLKPQPKFVGTLRIVSVSADKSVGQIVSPMGPASPMVQVGDQVASHLTPDVSKAKK